MEPAGGTAHSPARNGAESAMKGNALRIIKFFQFLCFIFSAIIFCMSDFIDKNTVFVLDSYGLIYREYFAFISRPLTNSKGMNVSAVFGFFRNLLYILKNYKPEFLVAAMDSMTPTFRHEIYKDYKATRPKTPEDLHAQIPYIERILGKLGIPVVRKNGYEADDIIATFAARAEREKRKTVILSADKDLQQLNNDFIHCMKPDKAKTWDELDGAKIFADWGVPAEKLLDLLSLMGDTADNVPGVKGIGQKTAAKLLDEYGTLEGIYENLGKMKGAVKTKLENGKDDAFFSKKLITLCTDVPGLPEISSLKISGLDFDGAAEIFSELEIKALARDYGNHGTSAHSRQAKRNGGSSGLGDLFDAADGKAADSAQIKTDKNESPRISENESKTAESHSGQNEKPADGTASPVKNHGDYKAVTDAAELFDFVDAAIKSQKCAFDTETDSLDTLKANLVGFSLAFEEGKGIYVPLIVSEPLLNGPVMQKKDAFDALRKLFSAKIKIVMHNGKFDLEVLQSNGLEILSSDKKIGCSIFNSGFTLCDTMVAAWLLEPDRNGKNAYGLEYLCETKLGIKGTEFEEIVPKGGSFADVPLETAAEYGAEDSDFTLKLWNYLEPELKKASLLDLFTNLEMPVLPVLAEMETNGIHLNSKYLADYSVELKKELSEIEKSIYAEVGHEFNIASPKQLSQVLFDERKLPTGKKTKTGYSTDTSVLEELAKKDKVPALILDYRAKSKLLSTYVETLPDDTDENGRIHTTFLQIGTATGRLSSKEPNLQNIPVRSEEGRKIRSAFTAVPGTALISADYAQIELVVLAHLSGDKNLCGAFEKGVDVHKSTASLIYGVPMDEVTAEMRRNSKTLNFGLMYGMGAFSLAKDLGINRTQAKEFIDNYFMIYSGVREFFDENVKKAEESGFIETIMGRKRYIHAINSKNHMEKEGAIRIAKNSPIQGSAADIVKKAMLDVAQALRRENNGARLLLQVHDELILECPDDEKILADTIALVKDKMENAVKLKVPLRVSIEHGKSWGEFH